MFKKILCALLASLMLLSAAACSKDPAPAGDEVGGGSSAAEETTTAAPETEPPEVLELPDKKYDNRDFNIFVEGNLANNNVYKTFYATDEEGGTVVNEATAKRNQKIEEEYGVKLVYHPGGKANDMSLYNNSVVAGAQAFDLCTAIATYGTASTLKGYMIDLATQKLIALDKSWYLPYLNSEFEVKGKMYVAGGFFDMTTFARTSCVFFSTKLAEDNKVEDLYALVQNNQWTYDKMLEIASKVGKDLNGDGVMEGAVDQFGLGGGYNMNSMLITTTGYRFTKLDENGNRVPTGITETLLNFNDLLVKTYNQSWYHNHYPVGGKSSFSAVGKPAFMENRTLFLLEDVSQSAGFSAEMESYGILPVPKYSADQKDFVAYCRPSCTGIALDVKDVECAATIYEALNYYSKEFLLPAYVETSLSSRYATSKEASEMMNLIFKNVACDFAQTWYNTIKVKPNLHNSCGATEDYASYFASISEQLNTKLKEISEGLGNIGQPAQEVK